MFHKKIKIYYRYVLYTYKFVDIHYYILPFDFEKKTENEKLDFLKTNAKFLYLFFSANDIYLIYLINDFRKRNNLQPLSMKTRRRMPKFIINPPINLILYTYNNVYRYNKNKFLFRYQIGEFERRLKNKDKIICDILLRENLNAILVFRQNDIKYIKIYQSQGPFVEDLKPSEKENLDVMFKMVKDDYDDLIEKVLNEDFYP